MCVLMPAGPWPAKTWGHEYIAAAPSPGSHLAVDRGLRRPGRFYWILLFAWVFAIWGAYGDGPTPPNAGLHAAEITVAVGVIAVAVAVAIGALAGRARRRALMITEFSLGVAIAG